MFHWLGPSGGWESDTYLGFGAVDVTKSSETGLGEKGGYHYP